MKKKFYLCMLAVALWTLSGNEALGQHHDKGSGGFEHVHSLAMDTQGQTLFSGAHTGLSRSKDGGRSWEKVALPAKHSHLDVMAVAPDPREPKTIYVGTHEAGVIKSTDGGATWKEVNSGLGGLDVHGLAIDPNSPSKLHAAVREKGEGIYRSTDGGGTWKPLGNGLKDLAAVTVNPEKANEVYTATMQGIIFKSADGGTKWERQQ